MRYCCFILLFVAAFSAVNIHAQEAKNTSYSLKSGERVLRHEAVIDAPLELVWETMTTAEGLRTFAAPVIALDFRIGGRWEASYDSAARIGDTTNIVNEVICILPMEMYAIRIVRTPPKFPHPEVAKTLWTVIQFNPLDTGRTRVVISMLGWKEGEGWDKVYGLFEWGNAWTLTSLAKRFVEGPRAWK